MGKKKTLKRGKARAEDLPAVPNPPDTGRKRVTATGSGGGHPCPGESPSRKKKSLSQFPSPSPNSKKRMQAAISAARVSARPVKKPRRDGDVQLPLMSANAFKRVLALDKAIRAVEAAEEARLQSAANSPVQPSVVAGQAENVSQSPSPKTTLEGSGSGVHVHIYVTPPQAPKENREEAILVDPLVRARRILEFGSRAPLSEVGVGGPGGSNLTSPRIVEVNAGAVEVRTVTTAAAAVDPEVPDPNSSAVPASEIENSGRLAPVTAVVEDIGGRQRGGDEVKVPGDVEFEEQGGDEIEVQEDVCPTAPENVLNSRTYDEEQQVERQPQVPPPTTNYSREVIEHLLSLLPAQEREDFIRTHPFPAIQNRSLELPKTLDTEELQGATLPDQFSSGRDGIGPSSPKSQTIVLSSTRSEDVQNQQFITEAKFQKTMRKLGREEKKYKKKQAKKRAKEGKDKGDGEAAGKEKIGRSAVQLRHPVDRGQRVSTPVGPNSSRHAHAKKGSSSGASSGTPSSSAALHSVENDDSVGLVSSWDAIQDIPPFQVNSLTAPTGEFWEHMRSTALEQAPFEFPWHLDWNKQSPELKARFTLKMRKLYPGPWDAKSILRTVGANLRERRTRLKRKFERSKKPKLVSRPAGCSRGSWMIIYESTKDALKQKKAKLCKEAADKRYKDQGPTHRCGSRGLKGIHDRFVDHFSRPPTDEELEYGKMNGWMDLKARVETSSVVLHAAQAKEIASGGSPSLIPDRNDLATEDEGNKSSTSDSSSSGTSEDTSSNDDSTTSESDED